MRRKRLQHIADTLCHMFCGWRQTFSKPHLVKLGSGRLEIDVLNGTCQFNKTPIEPLSVAAELHTWLERDLGQQGISKGALVKAVLYADLIFESVPWEPVHGSQFFLNGEPVRSGPMHRCTMKCTSIVGSDETEYRAELEESERWPVGWPAA